MLRVELNTYGIRICHRPAELHFDGFEDETHASSPNHSLRFCKPTEFVSKRGHPFDTALPHSKISIDTLLLETHGFKKAHLYPVVNAVAFLCARKTYRNGHYLRAYPTYHQTEHTRKQQYNSLEGILVSPYDALLPKRRGVKASIHKFLMSRFQRVHQVVRRIIR